MILSLSDFGVSFGDHVVLARVNLEIRDPGMVVLVGAAGSGKSTLLRTLAGLNEAQPGLNKWGRAELLGQPLGVGHRACLVYQKIHQLGVPLRENLVSAMPHRRSLSRLEQDREIDSLLTQTGLSHLLPLMDENVVLLDSADKMLVAIVRQLFSEPALLLVDEPTVRLSEEQSDRVIALLRNLAHKYALMVVTHNQRHAKALGGQTVLLSGGVTHGMDPTDDFFHDPETEVKQEFVRTGRNSLPNPNTREEDLAPDAPQPVRVELPASASHLVGPRGFYWLVPGKLGGCPRPGVVSELQSDLDALGRVAATHIINLEEDIYYDISEVQRAGYSVLHFPIEDMKTPSVETATALCSTIDELIADGRVVVAHCRAGLGRTGLVMALYALWLGETATAAFDQVRGINPKWIQSDMQIDFLTIFEAHLVDNKLLSRRPTE